jgi:uncharacterized membrane protein
MNILRLSVIMLVIGLASVTGDASVQAKGSQYITIDVPNAACTAPGDGTSLYGINPRGDVVGFYTDANEVLHAFLLSRGQYSTIDVPGSLFSVAFAIAPDGEIVGSNADSSGFHGFLYDRGKYTIFNVPGSQGTIPFAIDPQGDVVGQFFDGVGSGDHGFLRRADGRYTTFDVAGSSEGTVATGINPGGDITGFYTDASGLSHGFLRKLNGSVTSFDEPDAGAGTYPNAINSQADIAGGWVKDSTAFIVHGFLLTPDGKFTKFDDPDFQFDADPAAAGVDQGTSPHGITPQGIIAGKYTDAHACFHGFVRTSG